MPQDPLTQQLAQRALPQETPTPQGEPPLAFLQKPFEGGMDALLSAAGVRGQRPGDLATGLGAAAGAMMGAPKLPFGQLLHGASEVTEGAQDVSPLLREIFAKNPDAEAAYGRAMASQAPGMMANKAALGEARYARSANTHDALLDLDVADRPRPIPTDTGFATAIPLGRPAMKPSGSMVAPKPSLGAMGDAPPAINTNGMPGKAGITDDIVRDIRSMDPLMAQKKYGGLIPNAVLTKIMMGNAYGGVK